MGEWRSVRTRLEQVVHELAKFGTVGAFGFLVNVAVFNLCIHALDLATVRSGVIATAAAICTNYVGNRYWTYRDADKNRVRRELTLFMLFSGIGLVIENGVLALSHYGFGFTSPLADNIAKNVIGLGIGTVFRFWSYRNWVFRGDRSTQAVPAAEEATVDASADDGALVAAGGGEGGGSSARSRVLGLPAQEKREDRRVLLK